MTHTNSCDNPLRFWVKNFHFAFTAGEFGEGKSDCDSAGDINGAIKFLHSVVNAFLETTVMSRIFALTFDKPFISSFLLEALLHNS